jgi:hypothetical protein
MKSAYNHRLRLVAHARQHGIKPTARLFQTTVPTVRKWLRRVPQILPVSDLNSKIWRVVYAQINDSNKPGGGGTPISTNW